MYVKSGFGCNRTSYDFCVLYVYIWDDSTIDKITTEIEAIIIFLAFLSLSNHPGTAPVSLGNLWSAIVEKKPIPSFHINTNFLVSSHYVGAVTSEGFCIIKGFVFLEAELFILKFALNNAGYFEFEFAFAFTFTPLLFFGLVISGNTELWLLAGLKSLSFAAWVSGISIGLVTLFGESRSWIYES